MHLVLTSFHRGMYIPSACSDSCDSTGHKSLNCPAATSQDHLRVGRSAGKLISLQLISTSHLVTSVPPGGSNNHVLWSTENKRCSSLFSRNSHSLLTSHFLLQQLGPLSFLPLTNILNLLATSSFQCILLGKAQPWMNSIVYFLYFNCPSVEHCRKNHTPCRWCHYKLWSPTPSGPLLLLGSPSLFPWSAHPPILPFFYYNDHRFSSVMTHWVPTLDIECCCLLCTGLFQTSSALLRSLVSSPAPLLSPNPKLHCQPQ